MQQRCSHAAGTGQRKGRCLPEQTPARIDWSADGLDQSSKGRDDVATRLNEPAVKHAQALIEEGLFVDDERDAWSEDHLTAQQENGFIKAKGWREYAKWHLGIDDEADAETKEHYKFPYGDFEKVHRCGVLAAESRAGQYKYRDIEDAAAHLHGMLDALREAEARPS
jgi:hypothetical protein